MKKSAALLLCVENSKDLTKRAFLPYLHGKKQFGMVAAKEAVTNLV